MDQVLIQIVANDQGEVRVEYLAALVRFLPPEEIVVLLTHFAAELAKDAQEVLAGLQVGKLPPWVSPPPPRRRHAEARPCQRVVSFCSEGIEYPRHRLLRRVNRIHFLV